MNAMILLAQGAMNMADSLATANPVLTEVNAPEMNMLDMAIKGGWIMIVLYWAYCRLSVSIFCLNVTT